MDIRNYSANPCVGLCESNINGVCIGCGRTREERYLWYQMSEIEQREILDRLSNEPLCFNLKSS
ncbi:MULTISPECIES: DUF1289 domain-containing protein [Vibrio oreintalis group]|jgi:predicted Fe-S protein YdhL (DUF1289 family)|uniref:DUF1289 domain-containing protein n=2 Tax=Vibrio oreintalis group TaxID=1891919 RepID=A0AAE7AUX3_9VIBR|nr:DUF1289 domain-containing protein [Vibrio europaeus]NOH26142.1 DUF1289 domain-containing protein [Vibrio europaeus]NOI83666.1 DUF1289 domain-containing protein [Vibrio tubiashii]QJY35898.1 DUF1289 domain-containing protein [Vibrio europaeus]QPG37515.1 DUF1289 domain-containing protein [Vibrio europaeus]